MTRSRARHLFTPVCVVLALGVTSAHGADPNGDVDFARDVQPILAENCYFCHGPDAKRREADLRMDVLDPKQGPFAERDNGPAVVAGKPEDSLAMVRILTEDPDEQMPPPKSNRKLSPGQVEVIKRWIAQGAKWGKHWSLVPPVKPAVPEVKTKSWARNEVDRFVLSTLEREGLTPSPEAPKEALIRRVTLDLTGLPPTPDEVDAFVHDPSPDAYEKVVDRLLASPRYGERMVWEWLDAARYADTNGYQGDQTRTMWPWRDWAIRAINGNMPYDQFTVEQIAGDLMPNPAQEQRLATAFLRNHMINGEGGTIPEENRVNYVMDQAETVGTTWLGLTVGCARCHDHKYDPISQKDYYQLYAFFNNTPVNGGGGSGQTDPVLDLATPEQKERLKQVEADVKARAAELVELEKTVFARPDGVPVGEAPAAKGLPGSVLKALESPPEKRYLPSYKQILVEWKGQPEYKAAAKRFIDAADERAEIKARVPRVMVMEEQKKPRDSFILDKGSYQAPGAKVTADTLSALPPLPADVKKDRLALSQWLVSPDHPLTSRVTVNRFWQQFFGTGLVKTAEDFGVQGEKPSHPELLDWLARTFVDGGWNVKALHRQIVTSSTYRQSSKTTPALTERDPENRLLARGPRFRLPSFVLRDQALAASGLLVEKLGGPPVKPYQPPGIWEEATFGIIKYQQDHGDALYRRTLYTFWRRIVGPTMLFDVSPRQVCAVKTSRTNTPLHALTTLNEPTFVESARTMAQRVMIEAGAGRDARIDLAFRLVLARSPKAEERAVLTSALQRLKAQYAADKPAAVKLLGVGESKRDERLDPVEHAAYTGVCLAILNLDEAVTKE